MTEPDATPAPQGREGRKDALRHRIVDAMMALIAEGGADLSHDVVARRVGVGRRTVYRYFPDREALLQAVWLRVNETARADTSFPGSLEELIASLPAVHTGFDRIGPLAVFMRATPQGRAVRLSQNARRVAAYTRLAAEAVRELPEEDRLLATAMLQVLHTTPWLEMRDHWGLSGEQTARAAGWAIRALLADLKARKGLPLDQDPRQNDPRVRS